jgi:hypothetical protein
MYSAIDTVVAKLFKLNFVVKNLLQN